MDSLPGVSTDSSTKTRCASAPADVGLPGSPGSRQEVTALKYRRMPIEEESPEQFGYERIRCNLTESSVRDRSLADLGIELGDLLLFYGDHVGNETLRDLVAEQSGGAASGVSRDDVLVTAGAAQALFIIATSLLEKDDHLVVVRPNYATNIETPRAIGADVSFLDLAFDDGFRIDPEKLMALVTPRTKYVSITLPHNPTGVMMSEADLRGLVARVESAGCRLLVDETYREMTFGEPLPVAATLSERAISVSSLSKTYGIPGIRTGWLVCRDGELMKTFLAAKEQIGICGSVVDEEIAARAFAQRGAWLDRAPRRHRPAARRRAGVDGRRGVHGVGRARRRRRVLPAHQAGGPGGRGRVLSGARRRVRHLRRARALVRAGPAPHAHRLRVAAARGAGGRPGRRLRLDPGRAHEVTT